MSRKETHDRRRIATVVRLLEQLDALPYGPSKPCGLCGDTVLGQRHRIIEAVAERIRAGEPWQSVVEDWLGYGPDDALWTLDQVHIAADFAVYALAVTADV